MEAGSVPITMVMDMAMTRRISTTIIVEVGSMVIRRGYADYKDDQYNDHRGGGKYADY